MRKLLLFLLAVAYLSTALNAQVQGWQWAKRSSKNLEGYGFSFSRSTITTDRAGNVYMTAITTDTPNFKIDGHILPTRGKGDILLTSFDCEGNYRWSKVIGSSNDSDLVISANTDSMCNIYLSGFMTLKSRTGGSTNGHLDTDTTIIGNSYRTMFLAKWDSAGHFKWLRMPQPDTIGYLNANLYTSMFGMDVSPDGTVHLACYLSPGGYAGYNMRVNTPGAYVIRYAANGNYIGNTALNIRDDNGILVLRLWWLPLFHSNFKYDQVNSRYLVYGSVIGLVGARYIGGVPVFNNHGFLASFNAATGNVVFQKVQTYIPNSADTMLAITDLALDRSGNIFITGEALQGCIFNGLKFDNPLSQKSVFIIKMDGKTGDTLWTQLGRRSVNFGGLYPLTSERDYIAVSNGLVTTGGIFNDSLNFPGYSIHNNRTQDSVDVYMLQLNASTGAINNSVIVPTGPYPTVTGVGNDERGNFYLSGHCSDSIRFTSPSNPGGIAFYEPNTHPHVNPFWFLAKWGVPGCSCTVPNAHYVAGSGSGKTLVFTYTGTTLGIDSLVWDWGDGKSNAVKSGFSTPVSHTYATFGKQYNVCVNVYGDCGSNQYCGLSAPVSVVNVGTTASGILLYPNPANNYFTLENAQDARVEIRNSLGQNIRSFKVLHAREQIDVSGFSTGVYLLQITTANGQREQLSWLKQ